MTDELIPVDLDVSPEEFSSTFADLLQKKLGPGPQKLPSQTDKYVTAVWANVIVDNTILEIQKRLARSRPNAFGQYGLTPGDPGAANANSIALQTLLDLQTSFYIPPGTYYTSTNHITRTGSNMMGDGSGSTIFMHSGDNFLRAPVNTPSPISSDRVYNSHMSGFTVFGPGIDVAGSVGIDHSQMNKSNISDVEVWGFETSIKKSGYAYYCTFTSVFCEQAKWGLTADYGANSNTLVACKFGSMEKAFWVRQVDDMDPIDGTNEWIFLNCRSEGISESHYHIEALTQDGIRSIKIMGPRCESDNTSKAIVASQYVDQLFIENVYYSNLDPDLNDIQCPHNKFFEIRAEAMSHLSVFDVTNMTQLVQMLYRSSDERLHFCKNSNLSGYVNTVGKNHICVGADARLESAEWDASRGTTITAANFVLGPKWGAGAGNPVMIGNPKKSGGTIRITPNGAGIGANPTLVFTYPNSFASIPKFIINFNPDDSFGKGVSADANAMTLQINGYTPVAGTPIDITWIAIAAG